MAARSSIVTLALSAALATAACAAAGTLMVLQFLREVTHDEMVDAMKEGFAHTASVALAPQVEQFSAFFTEPLPEGSQTTFDYVPGTGTTVTISGKTRGTIPGADFMQALFEIWLGAQPADAGLKGGFSAVVEPVR